MVVGGGDVGVLGRHGIEHPLPEIAGEGQHVRLVHERQVTPGPGLRQLEGVAHAALDAHAGVHAALGGDLVGRALPQEPALAGVGPLGVLPHDDEVEVALLAGEWPEVDVLVEGEAEPEDDPPLDGPRRDNGVADGRAEGPLEDGVAGADALEIVVVEDVAVPGVAVGAEVEGDLLDRHAGGPHDLEGIGDHGRTDAVAGDHAYSMDHDVTPERKRPPGGRSGQRKPGPACATR